MDHSSEWNQDPPATGAEFGVFVCSRVKVVREVQSGVWIDLCKENWVLSPQMLKSIQARIAPHHLI